MCGQRFVQAVVSLVLIVESSDRYQNVATGVYFNLKKNPRVFVIFGHSNFIFGNYGFWKARFGGKATRRIFTLFPLASLFLMMEPPNSTKM